MNEKIISAFIRKFFAVPEDIQRLVNMITSDLLWGPIGFDDEWEKENYRDFQHACNRVRQFTDTLPTELWVDIDCGCVMSEEPIGEEIDGEWIELPWESIYHLHGHNQVIKTLFNRYVVDYI